MPISVRCENLTIPVRNFDLAVADRSPSLFKCNNCNLIFSRTKGVSSGIGLQKNGAISKLNSLWTPQSLPVALPHRSGSGQYRGLITALMAKCVSRVGRKSKLQFRLAWSHRQMFVQSACDRQQGKCTMKIISAHCRQSLSAFLATERSMVVLRTQCVGNDLPSVMRTRRRGSSK